MKMLQEREKEQFYLGKTKNCQPLNTQRAVKQVKIQKSESNNLLTDLKSLKGIKNLLIVYLQFFMFASVYN